ncbi:unnamed protein product [Caretta caretta]
MPSHNASRWHGEDVCRRHKEHSVDMQKGFNYCPAAPSQQAGDAGPMQELAELMQPEDASGGDRSAVLNGKLLGSAEMLNDGGLESGER